MKKIALLFVMAVSLILNANAGNKVGTKENTGKVKSEEENDDNYKNFK